MSQDEVREYLKKHKVATVQEMAFHYKKRTQSINSAIRGLIKMNAVQRNGKEVHYIGGD